MRIVPALMCEDSPLPGIVRYPFGVPSIDQALGGGLGCGQVHEIFPADSDDAAGAAAFAMALATRMAAPGQALLWLRTRQAARSGGVVQASGWAELGGIPDDGIVAVVPDDLALLRAAVDGLRCGALGAVIVESRGPLRELDLTASRRLTLAAERSGVPLFLLRMDAKPAPSAAQTRWQVACAPSCPLPGNAPGAPAFDVTLLRQKSGPSGLDWRLEWDRDQRMFREAPIPGSLVSLPAGGSAADTGGDRGQGRRYAA